ncbi:hypothetical protein [uncultured Polaribacter sp.]|uniref:hypothetical protein n=1 Tax=uncultured Polaribacter sp. TaxID=174711 RepID=UPI00261A6936|nr:hypothetical protein [uncultured Polaribacter sp.]
MPAHYININKLKEFIINILKKYFIADDLIENVSNYQIFLNKEKIAALGLDFNLVAQKLADEVINFDKIYKAVTARTLQTKPFNSGILNSLQKGTIKNYLAMF